MVSYDCDVTKHVGTAKHKGKLRMFSHPDPWQCFYQEVANLLFKVLIIFFYLYINEVELFISHSLVTKTCMSDNQKRGGCTSS
jgi:hypothetical protein